MLGMDLCLDGSRRLRVGAVVGLTAAIALLMSLVFAGTAAATHVSCDDVITTDTTLDSNVGPCPGTGIIIGADNVTLDLNGFSVIGDPQARAAAGDEARDHAGVVFRMVSGSTVRNGTVRDFDAGVVVRGGSGNAVRDVTARDNINYRIITGVNADPGDRDSIADDPPPCDLGDGIAVFNSNNNVIEGNEVVNNGPLSGISLVENSDANLVSRNLVADNDILNQVREGAAENVGERTVCGAAIAQGPMTTGRTMQNIGIRIEGPGADDNRVQRNRVTESGLVGIAIHGYVCNPPEPREGSDRPPAPVAPNNGGNLIFKNNVSGTGVRDAEGNLVDSVADGIATLQQGPPSIVCVAHSNTIKNNVSSDNERHGIFMGGRGSHDNKVINNRVNDNGGDGLHVEGPTIRNGEQVKPGAINNKLLANKGTGNDGFDGFDGNMDPPCDNNMWRGSKFDTVNQPCVWGPGGAKGSGGAKRGAPSGKARGHGRR